MRNLLLFSFSILLLISCTPSQQSFTTIKSNGVAPKGFVYVPSGSLQVNTSKISIQGFFILDHEVTNMEYQEFLTFLKKEGRTADYEKAKPQSKVWKKAKNDLTTIANLPELYYTHSAYKSFPVVGITKEAAQLYCDWLTETFIDPNVSASRYRLPVEVEWVYAARGGMDDYIYSWGTNLVNKKGKKYGNFKLEEAEEGGELMAASRSFRPNNFGIYNMSGNVAEFVSTTGKVKGGSWKDTPEYVQIEGKDAYNGTAEASPFIGFRPVMTFLGKSVN